MHHQDDIEDDEEVVCVPEDLIVESPEKCHQKNFIRKRIYLKWRKVTFSNSFTFLKFDMEKKRTNLANPY